MVGSSSHIWCEGCHKRRIHSTSRYRMCQPCQGLHKHALKEERRRIKNSRALKREQEHPNDMAARQEQQHITVEEAVAEYVVDQAVDRAVDEALDDGLETEEVVAAGVAAGLIAKRQEQRRLQRVAPSVNGTARREVKQPANRKKPDEKKPLRPSTQQVYASFDRLAAELPDDTKLAIGAAYDDFSYTTEQICATYHIGAGTLMAVVRLLGLTKRSERPEWKAGKRAGYLEARRQQTGEPSKLEVASDKRAAELFDELAAQATTTVKPVVPVPAVPDLPLHLEPVWSVRIEGSIDVEGERVEDVIAAVRRQYPKLRIVGVNII